MLRINTNHQNLLKKIIMHNVLSLSLKRQKKSGCFKEEREALYPWLKTPAPCRLTKR